MVSPYKVFIQSKRGIFLGMPLCDACYKEASGFACTTNFMKQDLLEDQGLDLGLLEETALGKVAMDFDHFLDPLEHLGLLVEEMLELLVS